ncbi:MAG: hypothetical protein GY849_17490 [Deltaproteobacteria bacterium]|nr:hypothetical protein [Deltaproteobacteria bacterium]
MKINGITFDIEDSGFGDGSVSIHIAETFDNEKKAKRFLSKLFPVLGQKTAKIETSYNIKDGIHDGSWGGYNIKFIADGMLHTAKSDTGVKGFNIPVKIKSENGILTVYNCA